MSSSRSASIRFQSVLDRFFVLFPFFTVCLSERDDANRLSRTLCERYKGNAAPNHPNSKPSLLTIVLIGIGPDKKSAAEHFLRIGEIEAVFPDIAPVLSRVP